MTGIMPTTLGHQWKDPPPGPRTPRLGWGLTYPVTYENNVVFNVFKIFVKIFVHNKIYQ